MEKLSLVHRCFLVFCAVQHFNKIIFRFWNNYVEFHINLPLALFSGLISHSRFGFRWVIIYHHICREDLFASLCFATFFFNIFCYIHTSVSLLLHFCMNVWYSNFLSYLVILLVVFLYFFIAYFLVILHSDVYIFLSSLFKPHFPISSWDFLFCAY